MVFIESDQLLPDQPTKQAAKSETGNDIHKIELMIRFRDRVPKLSY